MPFSKRILILTGLSCLIAQTGAGPCKPQTSSIVVTTDTITTTSIAQQMSDTTTIVATTATDTTTVSEQTTETSDETTTTTSDATSTTASAEPEPTSLLINGGFDNLPLTLEPWERYLGYGEQAQVSISNTVFRDGRASAHLITVDQARRNIDPQFIIQKLDEAKVSPGITYQLSAWFRSKAKASTSTGELACNAAILQAMYATNKYVARKSHLIKKVPDQWDSFSLQFTYSEEQFAQGDLYIWVGLICDKGGEGYIDTASLEIVPVDDAPATTTEASTTTSTTPLDGDPTE
ncbi:hypothetical protein FSARC_13689 [Fusarium sarcochroum]|uniref:CBM-cenC domain-containing protein n=1 Tax=Fusarium sarcochroum TaxID=1208366 RepID=A0A8H4SZN6_9HYPO|nr:hypothetical protein FSARC_13689 [Fusarium sarcochroum]